MKRKENDMKRFISMAAILLLLCGLLPTAALAADSYAQPAPAQALKSLGLFRGTDNGLELDRAPTRMESIIMLIRLLGKDTEALISHYDFPFTDAPTWFNADRYVGYAYANGLTNGTSEKTLSPNNTADMRTVVTLTLRALGYTDGENGSVWDNWETIAADAGLLKDFDNAELSSFLRGDAARVYFAALDCRMADGKSTLADTLIENEVFTKEQYATAKKIAAGSVTLSGSSLEDIGSAVYATAEGSFNSSSIVGTAITKDNEKFYLGTEGLDFVEGYAFEPMMTAQAHSLCLVRMKPGADIEAAKKAIRENVDPRKWICVGVEEENIRVVSSGDLILLVMDNYYSDALVNSFSALAK